MTKNSAFPEWLPGGLMAIDPEALAADCALGVIPGPAQRAETEAEWIARKAEEAVGLRVYPQLGLAVQPVRGVMAAGASPLWELFGLFNTSRLNRAAKAVAADPAIKTFVLELDTPGGYVTGVEEAAAAIEALPTIRKDLTVLGYAPRLAASAGMWIAAATEEFYAAPSATVGSIGVIATLTDSSRAFADMGLERIVFTDGKYKALGMPGVPVTEAQRDYMAASVAETSAAFKGYMERRRGLQPDAMQGQTFTARRAPLGMVSGTQFSDLDELVAVIAAGNL